MGRVSAAAGAQPNLERSVGFFQVAGNVQGFSAGLHIGKKNLAYLSLPGRTKKEIEVQGGIEGHEMDQRISKQDEFKKQPPITSDRRRYNSGNPKKHQQSAAFISGCSLCSP